MQCINFSNNLAVSSQGADVVLSAGSPNQPIVNVSTSIHSLIMMEGAQIMIVTGNILEEKDQNNCVWEPEFY